MFVSVIVPVYNVEKYLARCLDTLVAQDFDGYEIICVNDCSPDSSGDVLREYAAMHPKLIKVLENEQNLGLGKTRERALEFAKGDYVLFVDSDDYVRHDYISTYVRAANLGSYDIVAGGFIRDIEGRLKEHRLSDSVWSSTTYAIACAKLIRIDFIKENDLRFTAVSCGEDIYFSLSAFYCGARVKVIDYAGYYYVLNPASITGSMDYTKNHERIMADLFNSFLNRYDINMLSQYKRDVIEYVYLANMVNALVVFNRGCGVKLMRDKAEFVFNDAAKKFPNYLSNPFVGILKPWGQTLKIRLGVGIVIGLKRVKLEKPLLYLASLI